MAAGVVLCSPSALGFSVSCVQRCSSTFFGRNKWLFELVLPNKVGGECIKSYK